MSNDIGDEMQDAFVVEDFDTMKKLILAGSSPNSADRRDCWMSTKRLPAKHMTVYKYRKL